MHLFARGHLIAVLTGHSLGVLEPSASAHVVLMKVLELNPRLEYLDLSGTDGTVPSVLYCTVACVHAVVVYNRVFWLMLLCSSDRDHRQRRRM